MGAELSLCMLTLSKVTKGYAGRTLFRDVSLQINSGDGIGLVGPNGAGKSTLFSLILGHETPDEGSVHLDKRATVGFLPQENAPAGDITVLDLATAISPEVVDLKETLLELERSNRTHEPIYHDTRLRFEALDGYHLEPKAKRILAGLAFRPSDFTRPARELSGGWIMRAHLARLLVMEPDLLMLDEPTNHLDLQSLQWFQNYLRSYSGAILTISHDRAFLNALVTAIYDIDQSTVTRYRGNYDDYVMQREARYEQQLAAYQNQQREIEQLRRFIDRFRAKASKAAQAQSKLKQLERMEKIEAPVRVDARLHFRFPQPARGAQRTVILENIRQSYGNLTVYEKLDFEAERGDRIVLVGPNGAGKSTLLKILAGMVPFESGSRKLGDKVTLGYYSQHRTEMLDTSKSVLDNVMTSRHRVSEQDARTLLGCFLFSGDDVFKSTGVLSGGEKSRLALIQFLLNPPNLLLMDEPTTHLDMASIDAVVQALSQYEGTLVFISHDVYFIRALAKKVVHIEGGTLTPYAGDYDYYLEKTGASSAEARLTQAQPERHAEVKGGSAGENRSPRKTKEQKRLEAETRQQRSKEKKKLENSVAKLEAEIMELEARRDEIAKRLEEPEIYESQPAEAVRLNRELVTLEESLSELNARWEGQAEALAELVDQQV